MEAMVLAHGAVGVVALLAGLAAAVAPKRAGLHVVAGRVFAVSMSLALLAISVPIVLRTNVFMLGLGTVAGFALVEGWRALLRYRGTLPPRPTPVDYAAAGVTALVALGLTGFGVLGLVRSGNPLFAVCLAFAGLAAVLLRQAVGRWREEKVERKRWLGVHIGNMSGALGAAVTAAGIVNLEAYVGSWQWVLWVAPTAVSTVLAQRALRARGL